MKENGSGFFCSAKIGCFRPARNGHFRPTLTLTKKIAILNARHFGRSTEKLEALPGQMNIFNEVEHFAPEAIAEPDIEQVVIRRKKKRVS